MLESTWLFMGATALLATGMAMATQTQASAYFDRYADPIAIVAGLIGVVTWALLAYGSLNIRVVGDAVTYSFTQPSVTLWCAIMALPNLYVAVTGPMETLKRATAAEADDL